jgi:uncharacterized membrane protein
LNFPEIKTVLFSAAAVIAAKVVRVTIKIELMNHPGTLLIAAMLIMRKTANYIEKNRWNTTVDKYINLYKIINDAVSTT